MVSPRSIAAVLLVAVATLAPSGAVAQDGPRGRLAADSIDLGRVAPGAARDGTIRVSNIGDAVAEVLSAELVGDHPSDFEVDEDTPLVGRNVDPEGNPRRVDVWFSPTAVGARSAILRVTYDLNGADSDDRTDILDIALSGTAVDAEPGLVASPTSIDFGTVALGTFVRTTVTVTNVTTGPIEAGSISITTSSDLTFGAQTCSSLAAGETCQFQVQGTITRTGERTATIRLSSDDPHPVLTVTARVNGLAPPPPPDTKAPVMGAMYGPTPLGAILPNGRSARVQMAWSASDNRAVAGYTAQWRRPGGPWQTLVDQVAPFPDPLDPIRTRILKLGIGEIELRARARDAAGNVSGWLTNRYTLRYRDLLKTGVKLTGAWSTIRSTSAYGGGLLTTSRDRATLTITADLRSFVLIGRTTPTSGSVHVMVDGEMEAAVPLQSSTTVNGVPLMTWGRSERGRHTITITFHRRPGGGTHGEVDALVIGG